MTGVQTCALPIFDGEVGNKKQYDPRAWGKEAEAAMAARVVRACQDLRSAGTHQA